MPDFVFGQRQGGDDGDAVVWSGNGGKVDGDIVVQQARFAERSLAHDVVEQGAGVGEHDEAV